MIILICHLADNNALPPAPCQSAEHDHPHRLADNSVLAIFTRSLRRPTIACPEVLVGSPPRQAQLQIFNLALIPIIGSPTNQSHEAKQTHVETKKFAKRAYRTL
jgi:hypothetical protein